MPTPNVVGYVTEFQEDRPSLDVDPQLRFKLKLKNTLGQEMVVWAVLDETLASSKAVSVFYSSEMASAPVLLTNRSVDELAIQLKADLGGEKDAHDKAMDALVGDGPKRT